MTLMLGLGVNRLATGVGDRRWGWRTSSARHGTLVMARSIKELFAGFPRETPSPTPYGECTWALSWRGGAAKGAGVGGVAAAGESGIRWPQTRLACSAVPHRDSVAADGGS